MHPRTLPASISTSRCAGKSVSVSPLTAPCLLAPAWRTRNERRVRVLQCDHCPVSGGRSSCRWTAALNQPGCLTTPRDVWRDSAILFLSRCGNASRESARDCSDAVHFYPTHDPLARSVLSDYVGGHPGEESVRMPGLRPHI
ncbi:hypothetical protein CC80DRAFT_69855 [Byssothecium circinans]|uniref:Uncharacterized protein n=1 Tax=Byssothecium circinans TaxID=147558 RepID=A0A6A5TV01_9PLEO|nr:hypothetical protein CC80DRAFT_69855 [Byssothecium circinans]